MTDRSHSVLDELARDNPVPVEALGDSWATPGARRLLIEITSHSHTEASPPWDDLSWDDPIVAGGRFRSIRTPLFTAAALAACAALVIGIVFVTTGPQPQNAPATWQLVTAVRSPFRSLPSGSQPEDSVECVSDQVCYEHGLGTQPSSLWRTTDGGQVWSVTKVPLVAGATGFQLSCSGPTTCAALSQSGIPSTHQWEAQLAITADGGTKWKTATVPQPNGDVVTKFACSGEHCVVGSGGTFLSTSDGGATWAQASVPAISGQFWNVACQSDGSCLAVFLVQGGVQALSSTNWGVTWIAGALKPLPQVGPIVYSSCANGTHCMLVSVGGPSTRPFEIVTTDDAGASWQVSGPPAGWSNMPTAVACATATDCWIAMSTYGGGNALYSHPVIESTTDGGATWTPSALPATTPPLADVIDLSCPPSGDGCMGVGVGADHMVARPSQLHHPLSPPLVVSDLPGLPQS
jgi:photosystem II stability/assembly factor-like uncharacterized protein